MFFLGIDIGASSIKMVAVDEYGLIIASDRKVHEGSPIDCLRSMLDGIDQSNNKGCFPCELVSSQSVSSHDDCGGIAVTGSGATLVMALIANRDSDEANPLLNAVVELEDIPAITKGVALLAPSACSIMSMGAQSAAFITGFAEGKVPHFAMNESCAAGTGSFFEDQMERLGLPLNEYSHLVDKAQTVPRLSGRCSVFAKTDIIHRQQEGVPVEDILQGLCHATVKAFKATIIKGLSVEAPVALVGGTLLNTGVVRAVREVFDLGSDGLISDPALLMAQALGAAQYVREQRVEQGAIEDYCQAVEGRSQQGAIEDHSQKGTFGGRCQTIEDHHPEHTKKPHANSCLLGLQHALGSGIVTDTLPRLEPLPYIDCRASLGYELAPVRWDADGGEPTPVALGIDVGSTSTKVVLTSLDGKLYDAQYLRTRGNPKQAVRDGLTSLGQRIGNKAQVVAVGVTGSGRAIIGKMVGADAVRDEITAQARGAVAADPDVDTVFEIGGQDSKYISLSKGRVVNFQMNRVCAAGTGSFVEEQAGRLGIPLSDYGSIALSSTAPIDLGERCTVFVETAIHTALAKGASKADIAAGLCLSIVRNYLHKVVGTKPIGKRIVLQGGVAYNPAIVSAFRAYAGDALVVSPWFAVSGAIGSALLALEIQGLGMQQSRKGRSDLTQIPSLPVSNFKGWDLSGSVTSVRHIDPQEIAANRAFFHRVDELYEENYDPSENDRARPTVGIPRALMLHKLFPMANAFFQALGYNVLLSDVSNEEIVQRSQQCAQGETCYPVKLVHGHMSQLADAGVDYIFMPRVHTIRHAKSTADHNYACAYMQTIPEIVASELCFDERGITLLSPVFDMDFGQSAMATALLSVGAQLGKTPQESARAMLAGGFAVSEFTRKTEALGDELLAGLRPGERVFVIVTRNYGIVDPALNMGIPDMLLDRGCKVITVSHLHAHDLSIEPDYPDMYWPFGQHMISAAKLIRRDPRMFMVYLTNHGCGPDTMVSHIIRREMGDKPYLQIEMDEHFSKVGVETRVEAFLSSIETYEAQDLRDEPTSTSVVNVRCEPLRSVVALPSFGPYGTLCATWLKSLGYDVSLMEPTPEALEVGRAETTSKEYLTFTSLLGMTLAAVAQRGVTGLQQGQQSPQKPLSSVIIPGSQGGEADGQYARVIQSILDEKDISTRIVAPSLELLPCTRKTIDDLFVVLLAGDVLNAAPAELREDLLAETTEKTRGASPLCLAEVVSLATTVAQEHAKRSDCANTKDFEQKTLAIVGEWPLAVADELSGGVWGILEREGYGVKRMPLAEYLWFLWGDAFREAEHEKVVGETIPLLGEGMGTSAVGLPDDRIALSGAQVVSSGDTAVLLGAQIPLSGDGPALSGDHPCGVGAGDAHEGCGNAGYNEGDPSCHAHQLSCGIDAAGRAAALEKEVKERELFANPLCGACEQKLPREEWNAVLHRLAAMMDEVSQALGYASSFSCDRDELEQFASEGMGLYAGAGGRYRFAKAQQISREVDGVIVTASLYENTDTVIRLKGIPAEAPLLHLAFDGVLDQTTEERLRSFLYYLK